MADSPYRVSGAQRHDRQEPAVAEQEPADRVAGAADNQRSETGVHRGCRPVTRLKTASLISRSFHAITVAAVGASDSRDQRAQNGHGATTVGGRARRRPRGARGGLRPPGRPRDYGVSHGPAGLTQPWRRRAHRPARCGHIRCRRVHRPPAAPDRAARTFRPEHLPGPMASPRALSSAPGAQPGAQPRRWPAR